MEIHWNAAFRSTPPLLFPGGRLLKLDRVPARAQRLGPSNWPYPILGQYPKVPMVKSWKSSRGFSKAWLDANNVPGLRRAQKIWNPQYGLKRKIWNIQSRLSFIYYSSSWLEAQKIKARSSKPSHFFFTFAHFCFQWFLPSREQHHHLSAKILAGCDEKLECLGSWGQSNEIVHHELVSSEFYNRLWSIYKYDIVNKLIKTSNAMEELKTF